MRIVKITLVIRSGFELKREFSQKPLGYLITLKQKGRIDIGGMDPVWIQSARCIKQKRNNLAFFFLIYLMSIFEKRIPGSFFFFLRKTVTVLPIA